MASFEYLLGYRAALRHLIEASDAPVNQLKKMKITTKKRYATDIKEIVNKVMNGGGNYTLLEAELSSMCLNMDKEEVKPSQILQGIKQ